MRIEARRFTDLPEGCPVWRGEIFGYWHTAKPTQQGELGWMDLATTEPVDHEDLTVDLSTPAAIRAFAPALIVAVRFPEGRYNDSIFPPMPLWDVARDNYVLIGRILDSGALCAYVPRHELVTGDTPEEALLNGLKAALDAAKDAQ